MKTYDPKAKTARCKVCGFETSDDIFGQLAAAEHLRLNENEPKHAKALRDAERLRRTTGIQPHR